MSINSALLAGVSGLTANSAALAAISQNIANVNTVGYKRSAAEFQTVVNAQSAGAGYSAGGVLAGARHYTSQNGQLQRTTSSTDTAKIPGSTMSKYSSGNWNWTSVSNWPAISLGVSKLAG